MKPETERKLEMIRDDLDEASARAMLRKAIRRRQAAERALAEATEDIAIITAVARSRGLATMKDMAQEVGIGRRHLYTIQDEYGVGPEQVA